METAGRNDGTGRIGGTESRSSAKHQDKRKSLADKAYSWKGNEVELKQNLGEKERRTIGRDETKRMGRRIEEKVYASLQRKYVEREE